MNVGSLFSGIGGFDLGFERAGMRTLWFCEQDPYCRRVLAKHWPGVPCYPDVRALVADAPEPGRETRESDGVRAGSGQGQRPTPRSDSEGGLLPVQVPQVDVLCGGFPCQDISVAGKGAGITGARSGLWSEFARLIGELRPRYVVVENVPALLARGAGTVLGDLAAIGYDAEWDCLPASAFGAPHRRDRIWLVAYPNSGGQPQLPVDAKAPRDASATGRKLADASASGLPIGGGTSVRRSEAIKRPERRGGGDTGSQADALGLTDAERWEVEPALDRVVDGFPGRVDQVRALGNALVPQIAEWIGSRLMEHERERTHA